MAKKIEAELVLDTRDAKRSVDRLGGALKTLVGAAVVKGVVDLGNEFQEISNKLKGVTGSAAEAQRGFDLVTQISATTRSSISDTADLFTKLTMATADLGLTQTEIGGLTETFAKTLKISGANAQETASAILQFGQAMQSGKLSGDEFRSINESNGVLMEKLAKQLGVPRGELKKLASEGKLTSTVLAEALTGMADDVDAQFAKTTPTIAESFQAIRNSALLFIANLEEQTGVFNGLANVINIVANNLDKLGAIMAGVFAAQVAGQIMNVVKAIRAFRAANQAAAASAVLLQAVTGVGLVKVGVGLTAATATLVTMNAMFDDSAEAVEEVVDETGKLTGNTKEAFDAAEQLTEEQKAQKKEATEQARILADQMEKLKSISDELEIGRSELETQLDLQNSLIFATENQRQTIQAVADIEKDRADELRNLADLTLISDAERLQAEQDINDEYDERIKLTKQQLDIQQQIARAGQQFSTVMALVGKSAIDMQVSMGESLKLLEKSSLEEREALQLGLELRRRITAEELQLQEDIVEKERELAKSLGKTRTELNDAEKQQVRDLFKDREEDIAKSIASYDNLRDTVVNMFVEMRRASRTFNAGFREAFIQFKDDVTNSAKIGTDLFNTMTQGWEDAFVNFAKTGKLSFDDLFKALIEQLIRLAANQLFLFLFDPSGGFLTSLFSGFFDKGGHIPGGKFGIAGERGPEIVKGPATVVSTADTAEIMGGGTNVTYNINAVDPRSFKEILAQDPSFVYAVTRAGARKLPGVV